MRRTCSAAMCWGKNLILKNVSLLDILSVQNIFLWDDTQSNSAHSHNDFAISLTDHYFGNGTFFFPLIRADMPIFQFSFTNQKCLLFNAKPFLTKKCWLALPEINVKIHPMTPRSLFFLVTRMTLGSKQKPADLAHNPTLCISSALSSFPFSRNCVC